MAPVAIEAQIPPPSGRAAKRARSSPERRSRPVAPKPTRPLLSLLDDDPNVFSVGQWHERNLDLFEALVGRHLIDPEVVPHEAHRFITSSLIHSENPAATDSQN